MIESEFLDENLKNLQALLPVNKKVLNEWDLIVNESKTEFRKLYIGSWLERDEKEDLIKNGDP